MKAHLIGGGISSLAAAAYLIKDGNVLGPNITIFEMSDLVGGALDARGAADNAYFMRGGRMFEEKYQCTRDLLSFIPSIQDPTRSITEDIEAFYATASWNNLARLIGADGQILDAAQFGLSARDKLDLAKLSIEPEIALQSVRISDCFQPSYFKTAFWLMFATIFAFRPYDSAMEMRRYLHRFFHLVPTMATMAAVHRTRFNQYEAIVLPLQRWLRSLGVEVQVNTKVTDLNLDPATADILVSSLTIERDGEETQINVAPQDLVFVTNGSLVADATFGTMTEPPQFITGRVDGSWSLWEKLASLDPEFGNPQVFNAQPEFSAWESFTVTTSSPKFIDQVEHLSHRKAGRGGLMTLTASNWLITFTLFHHPHFVDQPEDRFLWWGYGLYVHEHGNFIDKPMLECSGAEILEEVVRHLGFDNDLEDIIDTSVCIPAVMPYAGSVFMPRKQGDRPKVVPDRSRNLAFLGQFTEMPEDVVYTVEYSVRSAWTAVAELLDLHRRPPNVFKGEYDPRIVYEVLKTLQT